MTTTSQPDRDAPRETVADVAPAHSGRSCWWCDAPLGDQRTRSITARNLRLTVHATCVPAMIHDGKIADHVVGGSVQLDADEI